MADEKIPDREVMEAFLCEQLASVAVAGTYCSTEGGWENFKDFLNMISLAQGKDMPESARSDIELGLYALRAIIGSPEIISFIVSLSIAEFQSMGMEQS